MRKYTKIFSTAVFISLCCLTVIVRPAFTQEKFPSKPITFIVPWAAGGGQDLAARALQPVIEKFTGVSVIVVNKPGGGASLGFAEVMNSPPDGYTLCHISPSINIVKYTIKDTPVSYEKFEPIIFSTYAPESLVVKSDSPFKTLKQFIDYAKANPGKLRVGNPGYGAIHHIGGIGLEQAAKIKLTHVPYKGTAAGFPDLLGGHIDAYLLSLNDVLHMIKGGVLRALGNACPQRFELTPEVQTFTEIGINHNVLSYHAWLGPKGIPKERVKILYDLFLRALNTQEIKEYYKSHGGVIAIKNPEEFGAFLEQEDKRWKELITVGGLSIKQN